MKKNILNITLALIATTALTNCRSDNNEETNEISIVGVWKIQKQQTISGANSQTILDEFIPQTDCEKKPTYEFTSDNKYINKDYVFINNTCTEDGSETTTYSYNKETKKLTISTSTGDVLELTKSTLVVSIAESDLNGDGIKDIDKTYFTR